MAGNSYGQLFRITTFGESHGPAIGVIIDGCPAGLKIDGTTIQKEVDRRRPGQSAITTPRSETDRVEILSGIFDGRTTGTPICLQIRNKDARPQDYANLKDTFRPSHADYTYETKYGHRDHRGGGRSSARETAARVAAGAVAKQLLMHQKMAVAAYVSQVGKVECPKSYLELDLTLTDNNPVRCPDLETAQRMQQAIEQARDEHDSLGGVITCVIKGVPVGLGEPVFDKLHAELGKAMLSINAVKGFEYGSGFAGTTLRGSEHNDEFYADEAKNIATRTNYSGGIQGGISNGQDIYFRVAFKPVATIARAQNTVTSAGNEIMLEAKGRHDPCVLPRAVPIVEAMAALVIADFWLRDKTSKLGI